MVAQGGPGRGLIDPFLSGSRCDLEREAATLRSRYQRSQIGLLSIDLRLGHVFARLKPSPGIVAQPARGFDPADHVEIEDASKGGFLSGGPIFRLPPGECRLAFTLEEVTLPPGLAANVQGKSSLARASLAVHITAPHIHPAWSGRITLEPCNHGPWPLEFVPGEDLVCR